MLATRMFIFHLWVPIDQRECKFIFFVVYFLYLTPFYSRRYIPKLHKISKELFSQYGYNSSSCDDSFRQFESALFYKLGISEYSVDTQRSVKNKLPGLWNDMCSKTGKTHKMVNF